MINFFQHPEFYALALMFSYRHMHESFPEKLCMKKNTEEMIKISLLMTHISVDL